MLKIIIIFMLLTLIGSPMNTSNPDNTSINKSLLNNSSSNDTEKSDLVMDISLFNWFSKPTKTAVGLNLKLALEDIKHEYLKNAVESYSAEKSMTEEDFSKRSIPPAINDGLEKYPKDNVDDEDPTIEPEPPFDPHEEWDSWMQKPPWGEDQDNWIEDQEMECYEVCDEEGICDTQCWNWEETF